MEEMGRTTTELAPGQVMVKCTHFCGFSVVGEQEFCDDMFEVHPHQERPDSPRAKWHESFFDAAFSFWGVLIVFFVASAVVALVNKTSF